MKTNAERCVPALRDAQDNISKRRVGGDTSSIYLSQPVERSLDVVQMLREQRGGSANLATTSAKGEA